MAAKRVYGPAAVAAGPVTIYTGPSVAGSVQKLTIRHINVTNNTASPATLTMSIGADAAGTRFITAYSVPANATVPFYGMYVLEGGEILTASSGTGSALILTVDGDLETV